MTHHRYPVIAVAAALLAGLAHAAPEQAKPKAGPAPAPAAPAPSAYPGRRPYTAEELKEIQEAVKEVELYKKAADSYKSTVNGIVKRAYEKRRKEMLDKYGVQIRVEEAEERVRRIAAITLFEDFLRRYPNDARWTPDIIFRLAELYFEKSNDEYLLATEKFEKDRDLFDKGQLAAAPEPPKQDYSNTIELHRKLIREFPNYRHVDGAYYLLGFCLSEMGETEKGNKVYLSLVCKNQHSLRQLDEPAAAPAAEPEPTRRGRRPVLASAEPAKPKFDTSAYASCQPMLPKSRFNPEAWVRIGEYHFDENQLGDAIAAYRKVLDFGPKDNAYYDEALYKLAWTYYRADKFLESIKHFDQLVKWADEQYEKTGKAGSEMRPESIQYLAISFAEEDWDGDTQPDPETGIQRIEKFYAGREKEKHVYEVYQRLAEIYFNTTKYTDSVKVYKLMLAKWPYNPNNPEVQDKVILALERERKFDDAIKEREEFTRLFGKGTEWERKNAQNPKALRRAQEFDEQALIQAAVYHHKLGQDLKTRGVALSDGKLLQQAANEYALAAKAYEKYLDRFPSTKNSYEIRYSLASCLFYSQRFLEAAKVFAEVRDSNIDNRYKEEAAFMATKSYEEYIAVGVKEGKLPDPALPKATDKLPTPITAQAMPEPYKLWQKSLDDYRKAFPGGSKTPRLTYKAAEISFRFLHFDDARKRFGDIYQTYCKDVMAINAYQAIQVTYQLEKNLDKMDEWAKKLTKGQCAGGSELATKTAKEAGDLIAGIRFTKAMNLFKAQRWDEAAKAFLAIVEADPKGQDADKALNNAAVCYEKSKRAESAAKIYERIWQQYPQSQYAGEALWRTAINYQKFFEFDRAVNNFLILSDSPRYTSNEHRNDAVYNAAVILENDQNYSRAAKLFLRYAGAVGKPKEAAEATFRAALIYEKMNDYNTMVKTFKDFTKKYGAVEGQAPRAVEAQYRIAVASKKRNDWPTAVRYFKLTMSEFSARGQGQGSEAAEYAGQAAFELAERKLDDFLKMKIKGAVNTLVVQEKAMSKKAIALKAEYEKAFNYKRARWMLAAMFRYGTIYEHFARTVGEGYRSAPLPPQLKRMRAEDRQMATDIYMQKLDELLVQRVQPLEDQAKKLYDACVKKAAELGLSNQYTEDAQKRLNAFDPVAYPLLKAPKFEVTIE